jgi:hypothetical protein
MDSAHISVLKEANEVRLSSLLQRKKSGTLEAGIAEVLRDLADEALEGELLNKQLGGLLIAADLAERHSARAVAVGLLHTAGRGRKFTMRAAGGFGCELLEGRLANSVLARS